jgi:hypothetical protein
VYAWDSHTQYFTPSLPGILLALQAALQHLGQMVRDMTLAEQVVVYRVSGARGGVACRDCRRSGGPRPQCKYLLPGSAVAP